MLETKIPLFLIYAGHDRSGPARVARGRCLSRFLVEVSGNTAASQEHPVRGGHYGQAGSAHLTTSYNIPSVSLYGMDGPLPPLISK